MVDYNIEGQVQVKQFRVGTVVQIGGKWYEITGEEIPDRKVVPAREVESGREDFLTSTGRVSGVRTEGDVNNLIIRGGDLEPWQIQAEQRAKAQEQAQPSKRQVVIEGKTYDVTPEGYVIFSGTDYEKYFGGSQGTIKFTQDQTNAILKMQTANKGDVIVPYTQDQLNQFLLGNKKAPFFGLGVVPPAGNVTLSTGDQGRPLIIPVDVQAQLDKNSEQARRDLAVKLDMGIVPTAQYYQFTQKQAEFRERMIGDLSKDLGTQVSVLGSPQLILESVGETAGLTLLSMYRGARGEKAEPVYAGVQLDKLFKRQAELNYDRATRYIESGYNQGVLFDISKQAAFEAGVTTAPIFLTGGLIESGGVLASIGRTAVVGFTAQQTIETIRNPTPTNIGYAALSLPFGFYTALKSSPLKYSRLEIESELSGIVGRETLYKGITFEMGQRTTGLVGITSGKVVFGIPEGLGKSLRVIGVKEGLLGETSTQPMGVFATRFFEKNIESFVTTPSRMLVEGKVIETGLQVDLFRTLVKSERLTAGTKSIYANTDILTKGTRILPDKAVRATLDFTKAQGGFPFGSFAIRAGLKKIYIREVGDIDIFFSGAREGRLASLTKSLADVLGKQGLRTRVPTESPYHIEVFKGGKWQKAIELKSQYVDDGSARVPARALGFDTSVSRYMTKIGGYKIASLTGEAKRKLAGTLMFQREGGGLGVAHIGRYKDVADVLRIRYSQLSSAYGRGQISGRVYNMEVGKISNLQKRLGIDLTKGETRIKFSLSDRSPSSARSLILRGYSSAGSKSGLPSISSYASASSRVYYIVKSASPSSSPSRSPSRLPSPSGSPSRSPRLSPSAYPSPSRSPSASPSSSPSRSPSPSPYPYPSRSRSPSQLPRSNIENMTGRGRGTSKIPKVPVKYRASLLGIIGGKTSTKIPRVTTGIGIRPVIVSGRRASGRRKRRGR